MLQQVAAEPIVDFLARGVQLKNVERQAWILKGIAPSESVADHSFNCALIALVYARARGMDEHRLISLALMHDIGKTVIGDVISQRGKTVNIQKQRAKHGEELAAIRDIFAGLNVPDVQDIVEDFLKQESEEARAMKEIDKLEMVMQALAYEQNVEDPNTLVEFWESAAKYLYSSFAWSLFESMKARSAITIPLPVRSIQ